MVRVATGESMEHRKGQGCPQNLTKVQESWVKKVKKNQNGTSTFIFTSRYNVNELTIKRIPQTLVTYTSKLLKEETRSYH